MLDNLSRFGEFLEEDYLVQQDDGDYEDQAGELIDPEARRKMLVRNMPRFASTSADYERSS